MDGINGICTARSPRRKEHEMSIEEAMERVEELIDDRKSFITGDTEHDEIYIKDIQALERALDALELLGC
jgi:hypothetical protein